MLNSFVLTKYNNYIFLYIKVFNRNSLRTITKYFLKSLKILIFKTCNKSMMRKEDQSCNDISRNQTSHLIFFMQM